MKFRIRYADKLVGLLIIFALVSLIFVIFMLGRTQRWFSVNHTYKTYAASALGLSQNMAVNCRGIPIGNVKSFDLTEDNRIEVIFTIQDEHKDRVREGSLVEISVSPIGFGSQFIFYPGLGGELEEGSLVPMRDSPEARSYIMRGLTYIPSHDDPVASIVDQARTVLSSLQSTLEGINVPPNTAAATALGQTIANIQQVTADLADGNTIDALEASLVSLSGILNDLERSTSYIPREMPQIVYLLSEARSALQTANDVLISIRNNPLIRGGVPQHAVIDSSGTNPRNIRF